MNTDEQRQILYAALLRYSPEAGSLRERALDRLVLVALLGSSQSEPVAIDRIQELTVLAPSSLGLRANVIEQTLSRLISSEKIDRVDATAGDCYFLTDLGQQQTDEATESAAQLFRPVLTRMLRDTAGLFPPLVGETVCRTFISECFARFGHQIAKAVTGDLASDGSLGGADIRGAFQSAIASVSLSEEAIETLRVRCNRFLHSMEPEDKNLRFRLAQNYYVAQLLELSPRDFNPLAEDAFSGAVFFLDTNVILDSVMSDESTQLFRELVTASGTLGIELRVTQATLNEVAQVTGRYVDDMEKVIDAVPKELLERTRDPFVQAYQAAREKDSRMTPGKFVERFQEIPNFLQELRITYDERSAVEIVGSQDVSKECSIVNDAAERTRGRGKSPNVRLHDVCHFLLVQRRRQTNPKAWFLTKDRTLSNAAIELAPEELPFCFPLTAFLQSVSPFLQSSTARHTLVDVFSAVLDGEVRDLTGRSLFDLTELRLISELHADVLSVPTDQLLPAFDFVKTNLLKGMPYRGENNQKVALELRKFLTSSAHEKQDALLEEIERQRNLASDERSKRTGAEQDVERMRSEIKRLNSEIEAADERDAARARNHRILSIGLATLGVIVASVCWWFDVEFAQVFADIFGIDEVNFASVGGTAARVFGAAIFVASLVPALSLVPSRPYRQLGYTLAAAVAIGASDIVGLPTVKAVSAYLAVATPVGMVIALALSGAKNRLNK